MAIALTGADLEEGTEKMCYAAKSPAKDLLKDSLKDSLKILLNIKSLLPTTKS
jgi:hypothetical protein